MSNFKHSAFRIFKTANEKAFTLLPFYLEYNYILFLIHYCSLIYSSYTLFFSPPPIYFFLCTRAVQSGDGHQLSDTQRSVAVWVSHSVDHIFVHYQQGVWRWGLRHQVLNSEINQNNYYYFFFFQLQQNLLHIAI